MKGDSTVYVNGIYTPITPLNGQKGIPSDSNTPGPGTSKVGWVDKAGKLLLFGGSGSDDLWQYNPVSNQWTWILGDTAITDIRYGSKGYPAPRNTPGWRYVTNTFSDSKGNCWLFGGSWGNGDYSFDLNDLWVLSGSPLNYATRASGNWSDPATWEGNIVPPASANIIIRNQVTGDVDTSCNTLKIEYPGSLTVSPGIHLSVLRSPVAF
jgi:hypothetical protein